MANEHEYCVLAIQPFKGQIGKKIEIGDVVDLDRFEFRYSYYSGRIGFEVYIKVEGQYFKPIFNEITENNVKNLYPSHLIGMIAVADPTIGQRYPVMWVFHPHLCPKSIVGLNVKDWLDSINYYDNYCDGDVEVKDGDLIKIDGQYPGVYEVLSPSALEYNRKIYALDTKDVEMCTQPTGIVVRVIHNYDETIKELKNKIEDAREDYQLHKEKYLRWSEEGDKYEMEQYKEWMEVDLGTIENLESEINEWYFDVSKDEFIFPGGIDDHPHDYKNTLWRFEFVDPTINLKDIHNLQKREMMERQLDDRDTPVGVEKMLLDGNFRDLQNIIPDIRIYDFIETVDGDTFQYRRMADGSEEFLRRNVFGADTDRTQKNTLRGRDEEVVEDVETETNSYLSEKQLDHFLETMKFDKRVKFGVKGQMKNMESVRGEYIDDNGKKFVLVFDGKKLKLGKNLQDIKDQIDYIYHDNYIGLIREESKYYGKKKGYLFF